VDGAKLTFKVESPNPGANGNRFFIAIDKTGEKNIQKYYSEEQFDMSVTLKNLEPGEYLFKVGYTARKSDELITKSFNIDLIPVVATIENFELENDLDFSFNVNYNINSNEAGEDGIHVDIYDSDGNYVWGYIYDVGNKIDCSGIVYLPGVYTINVYLEGNKILLATKKFTINPVPLIATIDNLTVIGNNVYFDINCVSFDRISLGGYPVKVYLLKDGELFRYSYFKQEYNSFHWQLDPGNYKIELNLYSRVNSGTLLKTLATSEFTITD
jgi:hypothetical protein